MTTAAGDADIHAALSGVTRVYPGTAATPPVHALGPLDLELKRGEFFAVVGPSGCGKSTLLEVLAGLQQPTAGTVTFEGRPVTGKVPDGIGVVFQEDASFPWMTVWDNAAFGLRRDGVASAEIRRRVDDALAFMGLAEFARAYPAQLSGGMRQRVCISRTLVLQPRLILLGIGGDHATERVGDVEVRSLPFNTTAPLADYYRAADLYVHSARAEAFGLVVAEALACGTPVVATAAGAVPELVRTLPFDQTQGIHSNEDAATGTLVAAGDASALAAAINLLLRDKALRQRLGANAAQDAAQRFGIDRQVQRYLDWFGEITSSP